ncbi:sodium- and chloride-dependent GABA transporter 2-like isoform X2 [Mya arenaria]|uniref:sodium- and chloride-dependent GABA transporter 2-like isoform X2 n=1 Tax=Mya arenaria TaxID=6604 RepID=UPI0022E730D3|nr:sodium- and chloride-dependent GABA transporter 2-like isoform X2 [Mya arenaria]
MELDSVNSSKKENGINGQDTKNNSGDDAKQPFLAIKPWLNNRNSESIKSTDSESSEPIKREQWSRNLEFMLACVGFAVGLGNIWRFPYLCYKNGGGAFLIPYLVCMLTCGVPIFLIELGLGQYTSISSLQAWGRLAPAFKGIGVSSLLVTFQLNIYYIVILAWAARYLVASLASVSGELPWATCGNHWNTNSCFTSLSESGNVSFGNASQAPNGTTDAVIEYWERHVLQLSDGIDSPGSVVWELALSLLVVWVLVYFCVWRGIKWSGKIVYFTAIFPYLILTVLLIRGVTLDGAIDGIVFYLRPDFSRLTDPQVWVDGGTQIFFSYAIAYGAMLNLGSYNKFSNNFYRDCVIISTINSCTSLFGGFAVFSVLGFMAREQNVTVADVAQSGPGLVFMTYPKAVIQMPAAPLWAILFFFMILLVGIDSQFVAVEGLLTPLYDLFPKQMYRPRNRMLSSALYCAISFLLGLTMVTQGGMYVFQLFDYYSASGIVLLWICLFETILVGWVFGGHKFVDAAELMIGRRIPTWFVVCWRYISPAIIMAILGFMLVDFKPLTYNKTYVYPGWAQTLGLLMALASMMGIPVVFMWTFYHTKGSLRERWRMVSSPLLKANQIPTHWTDVQDREETL